MRWALCESFGCLGGTEGLLEGAVSIEEYAGWAER